MTDLSADIHTPPYSLNVGLAPKSETFYQWTIRKSGAMFQRSDRNYTSEDKAWEAGKETVERLLHGFDHKGR